MADGIWKMVNQPSTIAISHQPSSQERAKRAAGWARY
jgi:hypothetical protein